MPVANYFGCCGALKPRYKRLVDGIYPVDAYEGSLVKNNMEKLLFFALSSPEKLDKIGKYMAKRLDRDVYRKRYGSVRTAMQALDQLLLWFRAPDHARNLNLFVESFLAMVRKLLETDEPELHILACTSFIKFANIEEDTPSYHRSYDFFISRFSTMCYDTNSDLLLRKKIRTSGMHALQGVVRKTVSDELQVNIWEEQHMGKIIPSLIYNMQEKYEMDKKPGGSSSTVIHSKSYSVAEDLANFAQDCLKDICSRTGYSNVRSVIHPALVHLDNQNLWLGGAFGRNCISTICYALPRQYAYRAVQILVAHLDDHIQDEAAIRTSIIRCLEATVEIASSVGPSVFEVFDALLRHLKRSTNSRHSVSDSERTFQEALVNAIGEFAKNLPHFQKVEVMQLILDKAKDAGAVLKHSTDGSKAAENFEMQCMLLESLLKVCASYEPRQMSVSFPTPLMDLLLPLSLSEMNHVRTLVHRILQSLIDRHGNLSKLPEPKLFLKAARNSEGIATCEFDITPEYTELTCETQVSSDDARFCRVQLPRILKRLTHSLEVSNNDGTSFRNLYRTVCLIILEFAHSNVDASLDVLRFILNAQDVAVPTADSESGEDAASKRASQGLRDGHRAAIMSLNGVLLNFLIYFAPKISAIQDYAFEKLGAWIDPANNYLQPDRAIKRLSLENEKIMEAIENGTIPLISRDKLIEILRSGESGFDAEALQKSDLHGSLDLSADFAGHHEFGSTVDVGSVNFSIEIDSDGESTGPVDLHGIPDPQSIRFESFKKLIDEPVENLRAEKERRQKDIWRFFKDAPVDELVRRVDDKRSRKPQVVELLLKPSPSEGSPSTASMSSSSSTSNDEAVVVPRLPKLKKYKKQKTGPPALKHFEAPDVLTY